MSVQVISIKCPECGAACNISSDRTECYCGYCGVKILIERDNEFIIRTIDEAGVRSADAKIREIDAGEKHSKNIVNIILQIFLILFGGFVVYAGMITSALGGGFGGGVLGGLVVCAAGVGIIWLGIKIRR